MRQYGNFKTITTDFNKLELRSHDAIYRLRFYSNSLIHILLLSNLYNNVASLQKNGAINRTV